MCINNNHSRHFSCASGDTTNMKEREGEKVCKIFNEFM